jgi:Zn-dependent protease with chaperone function
MLEQIKPYYRYLFLFLIMGAVSQWMVLSLYLTSMGQKRQILTEITDSPLINLIKVKTGLQLTSFRIIASPRLYAVMIGIPGKPYMMLSSRLNEEFTDSEKEYVVLHETGHYLLHHSVKEAIFFGLLFIIGAFIVHKRKWFVVPLAGVILGLVYIQFGMVSEYEADRFAVNHISDPHGMITATEKFKNAHNPPLNDAGLKWRLFYRSTPYRERIEMANKELQSSINND